ncbi:MAG TPA: cytochrome c biogenesis protein ResB, partial [Pyrinomonadaceae bacterium]|nr:cytochrome c biogenesis protein ResB [Pyrinomonadaceae bacterium]
MANVPIASKPVAGYTYRLAGFEKVADRHVLSVQRDPGSTVVYVGFVMLFITLVGVFFFSHQRVWVVLTENSEGTNTVVISGNTNRNPNGFQDKFERFVAELRDSSHKKEAA